MLVSIFGRWVNPGSIDAVVPNTDVAPGWSIVYLTSGLSFTVPAKPKEIMTELKSHLPLTQTPPQC